MHAPYHCHASAFQELPYTSGICNTNYKVAFCCVSCQHFCLVITYGLTRSGAVKYFEVDNDAMHFPVLDVMKSCRGVRCIITTRPMVGGPRSSLLTGFQLCCSLCKRSKTKDLFSYFVWCHIYDFICILMKR